MNNQEALTEFGEIILHIVQSNDDLTMRQLVLFLAIYHHGVRGSTKDYAGYMNVAKPVVTRAMDRLEQLQLMKRSFSPIDRRMVVVHKTAIGEAYYQHLLSLMNKEKEVRAA